MKDVAVFFGGESVEHEVSVITGTLTLNSLNRVLYNPLPVYVDHSGVWWTGRELRNVDNFKKLDYRKLKRVAIISGDNKLYEINGKKIKPIAELSAVINCMHGERGEDGTLAGIINASSIPFVSPDIAPSAIAMNKTLTKIALKGLGVKTLSYITVCGFGEINEKKAGTFPKIVKPECGGSSIGIKKANNLDELKDGINFALRYGERAIIEECLTDFTEINCAAYRNGEGKITVSECERPVGRDKVLSFSDKYVNGKREFPANIDKELSDKIKSITEKVYDKLQFTGVIRIDYFISGGEVYLNEINSVPGSLAYYLFGETLRSFTLLLSELIESAIIRGAKRETVIKRYDSGILTTVGSKGAKRL